MATISEQIADWLVAQGIEQVFSVTGGGAMFLNQAFGGHEKLSCTFMHHEQACAMAAEGYARIAGKPAVVMLTTGPGSINALNGVFGAFTDSIPMIVISGQIKRETCRDFYDVPDLRQLGDQEGPTITMAAPICKFARLIRQESEIETLLPRAYELSVSGRPGPVWLDIPLDIQQSTTALNIPSLRQLKPIVTDDLRLQTRVVVERLLKAQRPLIVGGTGVRLSGAIEKLKSFIEKHQLPMTTAWTHDLLPSDHPLHAGRPGTIGTRAGNFCLQNADLVIVLGSRLNIRQTSYNFKSFAKNAWLVQVDIDPAELQKPTYKPDFGVVADVGCFIDALEDELSQVRLPNFSPWIQWCHKINLDYNPMNEHKQATNAPLNPYVIVSDIFKHLRYDDVVVCGNASACILPYQVGTLQSGQRMFSNSGSASMGHELPAAIGAAIAVRQGRTRRVICFAGDGSLQMNIQELQTLKSSGLNIIIIVLNNRGYLSIWQTHENFFGRVIGATPESGVDFPDFCSVAQAYGIESHKVSSIEDIQVLNDLLSNDGPLLININVDPRQEFLPRIKSRIDENGKFMTPELDDMYPFIEQSKLNEIRTEAAAIRANPSVSR